MRRRDRSVVAIDVCRFDVSPITDSGKGWCDPHVRVVFDRRMMWCDQLTGPIRIIVAADERLRCAAAELVKRLQRCRSGGGPAICAVGRSNLKFVCGSHWPRAWQCRAPARTIFTPAKASSATRRYISSIDGRLVAPTCSACPLVCHRLYRRALRSACKESPAIRSSRSA